MAVVEVEVEVEVVVGVDAAKGVVGRSVADEAGAVVEVEVEAVKGVVARSDTETASKDVEEEEKGSGRDVEEEEKGSGRDVEEDEKGSGRVIEEEKGSDIVGEKAVIVGEAAFGTAASLGEREERVRSTDGKTNDAASSDSEVLTFKKSGASEAERDFNNDFVKEVTGGGF